MRTSLSVALGIFVGALPVYGFQLITILGLCIPLRLDAALAYLAANIANPFTIPLLVLAEIQIGALVLTGRLAASGLPGPDNVGEYAVHLAVGAPILGVVLGAAGGLTTLAIATRRTPLDPLTRATERVLRRYAHAPRHVRFAVRGKLELDPLPRALAALDVSLGDLIDAGCGLGQFGLLLLELGSARRLVGFDPMARSVEVAARAGPDATFHVAKFTTFKWTQADTILFADSLHYVDATTQDRILRQAVAHLRPGGRVIIREVDARPGWKSLLTRLGERLSSALKGQPSSHGYRSIEDLAKGLESLGMRVERRHRMPLDPFDNHLILAIREPDGTPSSHPKPSEEPATSVP
jgi:SAM-dependent methyltransferase